jgi:hypothetical protein
MLIAVHETKETPCNRGSEMEKKRTVTLAQIMDTMKETKNGEEETAQ